MCRALTAASGPFPCFQPPLLTLESLCEVISRYVRGHKRVNCTELARALIPLDPLSPVFSRA